LAARRILRLSRLVIVTTSFLAVSYLWCDLDRACMAILVWPSTGYGSVRAAPQRPL